VIFRSCSSVAIAVVGMLFGSSSYGSDLPYEQHENIVYHDSKEFGVGLIMDVFTPTGDANGLAIVDVASGAWHSDRGKINDHKKAQFYDIFCGRGYTVFAIRPGSINRFNGHDMLANLKTGIRWVKRHSAEYQIDPARLGLTGASAGGHLASLAALRPDDADEGQPDTRVQAAGVFFPPTDLLEYGERPFDSMSRVVRGLAAPRNGEVLDDEQLKASLIQLCPARQVTENAPPFLLIHGDKDLAVPLQQSELLLNELKKANVSAELIVKKGGGHAWLTIHEEVQALADWFDGQLSTAGTDTTSEPAGGN